MCLVEVVPAAGRSAMQLDVLRWDPEAGAYVPEHKPKLVASCHALATDGMVIRSDSSDHVRRARSSVQEMLLLNHPVDCPICDQAGECRLQDYWRDHQATAKRMRDEIVHKPKAVRFGPHIVYDAERCILCTRCLRLCDEIARDSVLAKRERGNLSEITLAPGRELDHPYSLMTEVVCPVGALTAVEFRFKARVWFLRSARTICPGCATGCNAYLDYDPRTNLAYRHRPRENLAVNQFWMCDAGMLSTQRLRDNRVTGARVRHQSTSIDKALRAAVRRLRGVPAARLGVVLSAQHSLEDNQALHDLACGRLGVERLFISGRPVGEGDAVLRDPDQNPNTGGVEQICGDLAPQGFDALGAAVERGEITHALVLGGDVPDPDRISSLDLLQDLVVLATHETPLVEQADVVLPVCCWAEARGSYVNAKGMTQVSERAVRAPGDARPAWRLIQALGDGLGAEVDSTVGGTA
jgi:NADH-quinone oxidoreductase subunit G